MRRSTWPALTLALLLSFAACRGQPAQPEIALEVVKQADYLKVLGGQRGKVVVVDIWGDFCAPCKEEFPHLVELHEKYAGKGVACVSVSVDPVEDKERARKFLQRQKATFTNVLLDEPPKAWQELFDIYGPPAMLVFDRDGKLAARFDHNDANKKYSHADVEKAVLKLLTK